MVTASSRTGSTATCKVKQPITEGRSRVQQTYTGVDLVLLSRWSTLPAYQARHCGASAVFAMTDTGHSQPEPCYRLRCHTGLAKQASQAECFQVKQPDTADLLQIAVT